MTMSKEMRRLVGLAIGALLIASLAAAESPAPLARASDAMSMHGVWYSRDVYLPLYSDVGVLKYFADIPSDVVVLPVYTPTPLHFRRGRFLFVSTGFLLQCRSERELLDATIPSASPGSGAGFHEVQTRLRSQIAEYEAESRSHLRRR